MTIDPVEARELVGSCQQLSQPGCLIRHGKYREGGFAGKHLIITEEFYKINEGGVIGPLAKGTRLKVRSVLKDDNLTASCWHIEVQVLDGQFAGSLSELPACYVGHPPTWLNSDAPGYLTTDQLKIKPEYAVLCSGAVLNR